MLTNRRICLIFLFIFLINPFLSAEERNAPRNILILFSFAPTTPAYHVITDGIRTRLTESFGDSYNLHMEYLETERYPKDNYPHERFEVYNKKYSSVKLDLIICIGIDHVATIKKHASAQLLNLPAITIDFDFSEIGYFIETNLNDQTAVIQFKVNAFETISTALELFPGTESIFLFSGISRSDQLMSKLSLNALQRIDPKVKTTFINDLSMDDVLRSVRQITGKSIILIPNFNTDQNGIPYYNPEAVRLISKVAHVPVFILTETGFGEGAIGGYLLSYEKLGLFGGDVAVSILNGRDPGSIQVNESDYYHYIFDWRELQRWGLSGSKLIPKDSVIRFEKPNLFKTYRGYIIFILVFLAVQSFMIILLIRFNRKQKQITLQLLETENKFRNLIKEDRIMRVGQLTASLSHELNQPLTAILSTAQAGRRFVESGNFDQSLLTEIFSNIIEDDKRTASILSSIRGMMKLEKREKAKVNLNEVIEEGVSIFIAEALEKKVSIRTFLTEQPVFVLADSIQLQQVLLNFLVNAAQAISRTKGKGKDRDIHIRQSVHEDNTIISVSDQGGGIDETIMKNLFKPFLTTKKESLGIGLAISREIIEEHQGKIWAENIPGGAKFSFSLKIIGNDD